MRSNLPTGRILALLEAQLFVLMLTAVTGSEAVAANYQGFDVYPVPASQDPFPIADPSSCLVARGQTVYNDIVFLVPGDPVSSQNHAILANAPAGALTDIHPLAGYSQSRVQATDGVHQVGSGQRTGFGSEALLWSGTGGSVVNLSSPAIGVSAAMGVSGNQQVGVASTLPTTWSHPMLWNGTAASAVDLSPDPQDTQHFSYAYGTDGTHQVGAVGNHAALWSGTAASFVDLHPSGFNVSEVRGVAGNQQVGSGEQVGTHFIRALMWSGTAASVIDLTPENLNFFGGMALATNGVNQVGWCGFAGSESAFLWSGSAASAVNLQELLPAGFRSSRAYSIDDTGTIWGLAASADDGLTHVVEWTAVPEPSTLLTTAAFAGLALRRSRCACH